MYLLKVESRNPAEEGFKYFTLPAEFDLLKNAGKRLIEKKITTHIVYGKYDSKNLEEFTIEAEQVENLEDQLEDQEYYTMKKGWSCISFSENDEIVDILFDGKAYLIKDSGKTLEMF